MFKKSRVGKNVLKYLVEATLTGTAPVANKILAEDVYGSIDQTVQARDGVRNVRDKLGLYYADSKTDPIEFEIITPEQGGYFVVFHIHEQKSACVAYLTRLIEECSKTPSYFPVRLRSGFLHMRQQVQIVTEPERFDRIRAEELERQRATGMPDWAPLRSHSSQINGRTDENDQSRHRILDWDTTREPKTEDDRKAFQKTVVLGDPGFGKSWLLRSEAIRLALIAQKAIANGAPVATVELPVLVRLADLARQALADTNSNSRATLGNSIANTLLTYSHYPEEEVEVVRNALNAKQAAILLDAWDEVNAEDDIFNRLSGFATTYPGRIVATSRGARYQAGLLGKEASQVEILAFRPADIGKFIEGWFENVDTELGKVLHEKLTNLSPVQGLARIPLLLSLICLTFERARELPQTRGKLYDHVLRGLLYEWPKYNDRLGIGGLNEIHYKNRDLPNLGKLAWEMQLRDQFDGQILDTAWGVHSADKLLEKYDQAGIFVKVGDGARMLLHRTFQEYLTAFELSQREDCIQHVDDLSLDPAWHEVIVLLAAHMNPVPIVEMLRHERKDCVTRKLLPRLALAGRVLAEGGVKVSKEITKLRSIIFDALAIWKERPAELGDLKGVKAAYQHVWRSLGSLLNADPGLPLDLIAVELLQTALPARVELCIRTLNSPDALVRRAAAEALGKMGPSVGKPAIAALVEVISKPDSDALVRRAAAEALGKMGPGVGKPAIAALVEVITKPDSDALVRRAAAGALGELGLGVAECAVAELVEVITKPNPDADASWVAAGALGELGPGVGEHAISALVEVITKPNPDADASCAAARALGKMGPGAGEPAIAALVEMVTKPDADADVLRDAAWALRNPPSLEKPSIPVLVEVITKPHPDASRRRAAVDALGYLGPSVGEPAIAALVEVITKPDPDFHVRLAATMTFSRMGSGVGESAIVALVNILTQPHPDSEARSAAAMTLGHMGPDAGEPAIAALVEVISKPDPDRRVFHAAAKALGRIGPCVGQPAIDALVQLIGKPDSDVEARSAAARALGEIGPSVGEGAIAALIAVISKPAPYDMFWAAADALREIGPCVGEPAIAALIAVLTTPDPYADVPMPITSGEPIARAMRNRVRRSAAEALGRLTSEGLLRRS